MSDINTLIPVNISKKTAVASQPGFGVLGIIARFATAKSPKAVGNFSTVFPRSRTYTSTDAMIADGWVAADAVVLAAAKYFQQSPRPAKVLVGRLDAADADIAAGLSAIQLENADWYGIVLVGYCTATLTLSTALITGNSVAAVVDGVTIPSVVYATSHAATMALLKTAIETAIAGSTATVAGNAITVAMPGRDFNAISAVVTGGASQPTVAASYAQLDTAVKATADWAQQRVKEFYAQDHSASLLDSGSTADLASYFKTSALDQSSLWYTGNPANYIGAAVAGKLLPSTPGKLTVADKALVGVTPDALTSAQEDALWAKNGNSYTVTGGLPLTNNGTTGTGDYLDTIRNIAWLKSKLQVTALTNIANADSVSFDDPGIVLVGSWLESDMLLAESNGVLIKGSTEITLPKFASLDPVDIAARTLKGVSASAKIKNSIQRVQFDITLTN